MMIGCKQMENSILSYFGTMIYIFLKLVIKNLQLHYSILFHRVTHLNQHHLIKKNREIISSTVENQHPHFNQEECLSF